MIKRTSSAVVALLAVALVMNASPPSAAEETPPPSPSPTIVPDPTPTASPIEKPTPAPTPAPTPQVTPTPTPSPTAAPTPTPLPYPSDPVAFIDAPAPNADVFSGTLAVWGWAIDRNARGTEPGVDNVVLYLDGPPGVGSLIGTAPYGFGRPDVGNYFGDARWNNSGWGLNWSVGSLPAGTHTIYAVIHSTVTNATTSFAQSMSFVPPPPAPAPPRPPAAYSVPDGAVVVSDAAGLLSALAATTPQDIVLTSGVYDNAGPFVNVNGHRLYSATLGGAVLKAGLVLGGNSGPGGAVVQGLAFDVSDPSKTLQNSIIHVWGTAQGSRILDTTFNGNNLVGTAILARQPEGLVVQRVQARNFTVNGITVDANVQDLALSTPVLLEDIDVVNVSYAVPKSSDGTAEACIWLGNTGTLRRASVRNCAWTGLWTGTSAAGALLEDLDIDSAAAGLYIEHFTTNTTFQRMRIGPNTWTGVACEWAGPSWGSRPACDGDVIQDSYIASADTGVLLDVGTTRTTIRRVKFVGAGSAAIKDFGGVNNTYVDNDYREIAPGAVPVAH